MGAVAAVVVGAAALAVLRLGDGGEDRAQPVHVEVHAQRFLCAEVHAVPANASSDGAQYVPGVEAAQDLRCDQAVSLAPGEVDLPAHSEADAAVGSVVLAGELRFDDQRRCFYVVAGGDPIGMLWPARFTGEVDPPRIAGDDGSTVVTAGDRFEVRGRYISAVGVECGPVAVESPGFVAGGDVELIDG